MQVLKNYHQYWTKYTFIDSFHFIHQMKALASPLLTDNLVAAFNSKFNIQIEILVFWNSLKVFLFRRDS